MKVSGSLTIVNRIRTWPVVVLSQLTYRRRRYAYRFASPEKIRDANDRERARARYISRGVWRRCLSDDAAQSDIRF